MDPVNCNMIRIFFILLISLPVFGQNDVQYNILMIEQDSGYSLQYERLSYDANPRKGTLTKSSSKDSFLMWLFKDLENLQSGRKELLFYIHGMWGSQRANFQRAYNLMNDQFIKSEDSDIARIVSLKWPGNDFDYRENKERIPKLVPVLQTELVELIRRFQLSWMWIYKERRDWDVLIHSLGNELARQVFRDLPDREYEEKLFENIIFAASDLDHDIYSKDSLMQRFHSLAEHCYIYYSERDLTLEVSKNLNKLDRLGRAGPSDYSSLPDNTTAIDVSLVKDENNFPDLITGHSYFRASPLVTCDMLNSMMMRSASVLNYRREKEDTRNHFLISPKDVY